MTEVEDKLGAVLRDSLQPQSSLHVFNFLANSVLAAADEALAESLPGTVPHVHSTPVKFLHIYGSQTKSST